MTFRNNPFKFILPFCGLIILIAACKSTEYGYAIKDEDAKMKVQENPNAINYLALKKQDIPTMADRASSLSRGLPITPLVGGAVSLATSAIKQMIANDRKKYIADYSFALTELYFYDQLSTESCFDPVGMQFNGFTLVRTFTNKNGATDTAFKADFALDTTKPNEIINNSIFRLKLKDLKLNYTKAKITSGQKSNINMDIEITFLTSYVNDRGQLFDKVELGKFYLNLRNAPLDKNIEGYASYYNNLKGQPVEGKSFIVPRSFGYYINGENESARCFSQGAYSIEVKVRESSKDKFVTKILVDNSGKIIDALGDKVKGVVTTGKL